MNDLMLSTVTLEFSQDGDSDQTYGTMQELEVIITHAGGGPYFILKTERWAMDGPDEINNLLTAVGGQVFPLFETVNEPGKADPCPDPSN